MFDFLRNLTQSAEEKRQETITAYLDETLSSVDRARFEAALAEDPNLQAELERERLLKEALSQLPPRRSPRNFALNPALYGRPAKQPLIHAYPLLRAATGLTAVFFIFALFASIYIAGGGSGRTQDLASAPVAESAAIATAAINDGVAGEQIEVTRVVSEIVVETDEVFEESEAEMESPEMGEVAPAEEETTAEEGFSEELDDSAPAEAAMEEEAMEDAPVPTQTSTVQPTPTIAPTATVSQLPRATATAVLADRAVDTTSEAADGVANLAPDDETVINETAVPQQSEQASNPSTQINPYLIMLISLFLLFLILGTVTLYTKRQL